MPYIANIHYDWEANAPLRAAVCVKTTLTTYNSRDAKLSRLPSKKILREKAIRGLLPKLRKEECIHFFSDHSPVDSQGNRSTKYQGSAPEFAKNVPSNQLKPVLAKRRNYLLNELRGLPKIGSLHTRNNLSEVNNSFNINKVTLFESKQQQLVDFRKITNSKMNILFSPTARDKVFIEL